MKRNTIKCAAVAGCIWTLLFGIDVAISATAKSGKVSTPVYIAAVYHPTEPGVFNFHIKFEKNPAGIINRKSVAVEFESAELSIESVGHTTTGKFDPNDLKSIDDLQQFILSDRKCREGRVTVKLTKSEPKKIVITVPVNPKNVYLSRNQKQVLRVEGVTIPFFMFIGSQYGVQAGSLTFDPHLVYLVDAVLEEQKPKPAAFDGEIRFVDQADSTAPIHFKRKR